MDIRCYTKRLPLRVSFLNEQIAALEIVIVAMKKEKARVCKVIERYKWILRPTQGLPPELLGRIFSFAVDSSIPEDPFQTPSSLHPKSMPSLAQVCQTWRKVASSTASLWQLISLALYSSGTARNIMQTQAYRLNLQLHRSGDQPLEVIVSTRNAAINMDPLLFLLYSQSHSWRTLHVDLDDRDTSTV
ncbi:hypothetical protein L218DRAFT_711540 [Marasmius fiardii PR-910]|nr:hypothetical protein L218DRAFT_711540 [Marasmius fiardii PR-910]